jgi:hypothetical protein
MAIADQKKYAQTAKDAAGEGDDQTLQEQLDALKGQLETILEAQGKLGPKSGIGAVDDERLEKILLRVAQMSADAHERAANPSNKTHPAISVFSRPKGDRDDPRDALKCEMFWVGYPVDTDTTTDEEINLLNVAEPGTFQFTRTDRTTDTLTVIGERAPDGQIAKLLFTFPTRENRESLPSMCAMLKSAFNVKTPEQIELDKLRAEVERLRSAATVGA